MRDTNCINHMMNINQHSYVIAKKENIILACINRVIDFKSHKRAIPLWITLVRTTAIAVHPRFRKIWTNRNRQKESQQMCSVPCEIRGNYCRYVQPSEKLTECGVSQHALSDYRDFHTEKCLDPFSFILECSMQNNGLRIGTQMKRPNGKSSLSRSQLAVSPIRLRNQQYIDQDFFIATGLVKDFCNSECDLLHLIFV